MKQQLRVGILLALALTLGACAPQQGTDASEEPAPSQAPASVAPSTTEPTVAPSATAQPSESTNPTPTPYDYDY